MTNATPALPIRTGVSREGRPSIRGTRPGGLRLAAGGPAADQAESARPRPLVTLHNPDLVAELRQARAARFANRYEWLALRRRRAQIAARHAVGD
jgi:hypothetical protein